MRRSERVVLDTNVVLSALLFANGSLKPLRDGWHNGTIVPLASAATIAELIRALAYPKFGLSEPDQRELLGDYLPSCESVTVHPPLDHLPRCRDPHDQKFLELAVAGNAAWLLTGDRDLLALEGRVACRIATPAEFAASFPSGESPP